MDPSSPRRRPIFFRGLGVLALERRWAGRDRGSLRLVNKPFLVGPNGEARPSAMAGGQLKSDQAARVRLAGTPSSAAMSWVAQARVISLSTSRSSSLSSLARSVAWSVTRSLTSRPSFARSRGGGAAINRRGWRSTRRCSSEARPRLPPQAQPLSTCPATPPPLPRLPRHRPTGHLAAQREQEALPGPSGVGAALACASTLL